MLFVSSKVSQLALLPQGRPEAAKRAKAMMAKMEELGFGNCTNTRACEAVCTGVSFVVLLFIICYWYSFYYK